MSSIKSTIASIQRLVLFPRGPEQTLFAMRGSVTESTPGYWTTPSGLDVVASTEFGIPECLRLSDGQSQAEVIEGAPFSVNGQVRMTQLVIKHFHIPDASPDPFPLIACRNGAANLGWDLRIRPKPNNAVGSNWIKFLPSGAQQSRSNNEPWFNHYLTKPKTLTIRYFPHLSRRFVDPDTFVGIVMVGTENPSRTRIIRVSDQPEVTATDMRWRFWIGNGSNSDVRFSSLSVQHFEIQ